MAHGPRVPHTLGIYDTNTKNNCTVHNQCVVHYSAAHCKTRQIMHTYVIMQDTMSRITYLLLMEWQTLKRQGMAHCCRC